MENSRRKSLGKLWLFPIVGILYIVIINADTFDFQEDLWNYLRLLSTIVSFAGGILFFCSFFVFPIFAFRLFKRRFPGQLIIWTLLIGSLTFVDFKYTRMLFLDNSKEQMIENAEPLITAINQYRIDIGSYPTDLNNLVPRHIESIPKPTQIKWKNFKYKSFDSSYSLGFNQWIGGRTYRTIVYSPSGTVSPPEFASEVRDTDLENWKYYLY